MSQKNASKILPAASDIPFGHSWHNTKTPSVVRNGLSAVTMPSRSVPVPINPQWGRESYAVTQQPLAVWWYPLSALPRKMILPAAFTFQLHNAPPLLDTNTTLPLAAGRYAAGITSLAYNSPVWKDAEGEASPLATTRRPILVNVTRIEYGPSKLADSLRVRENYAGIGSVVLHTPVHPAYALFGLPSMTTRPVCSP